VKLFNVIFIFLGECKESWGKWTPKNRDWNSCFSGAWNKACSRTCSTSRTCYGNSSWRWRWR